jgi:hypothetical protein
MMGGRGTDRLFGGRGRDTLLGEAGKEIKPPVSAHSSISAPSVTVRVRGMRK